MTEKRIPELDNASIIIACGAGVRTEEDFALVKDLADCLGADIAGTRPAVDRGFISRGQMIGQTGIVVRPDLYIAIGISGSHQHRAGLHESAVIIAVNPDADAPIFTVADYGIIADLREVVPRMIRARLAGAGFHQIIEASIQGVDNAKLVHG